MKLTDWIVSVASAINALSVVILVCITSRYAASTEKILEESRKMREAAEKQATTAQMSLEFLQRGFEEQTGLGKVAIKSEIARAITVIEYWQALPLTELRVASSLPDPNDLIPANLPVILDQARRVSPFVGELTSAGFENLELAKNEVARLKNADLVRHTSNSYDSTASKAPAYLSEGLRKFQEAQDTIARLS